MLQYVAVFVISYILGSIPFGLIVGRRICGKDIREYGSHNIGATNAYRAFGAWIALLVLFLDMLKGGLAVYLGQVYLGLPWAVLVSGLLAIAGHNWPVFLGFRGGRGIATSVGVVFMIMPEVVLILLGIWIILVAVTRYVSLGSIAGAVLLPALAFFFDYPSEFVGFSIFIAIFAVYRHRPNIRRLLAGEENKLRRLGQK